MPRESVEVDRTDDGLLQGKSLGSKFEQQKYVKWRTGVCARRERQGGVWWRDAGPRSLLPSRAAFQRLASTVPGFSDAACLGCSFAGMLMTNGWTLALRGTTETTKISE